MARSKYHVRWMIHSDIDSALKADTLFQFMDEADLKARIGKRNVIGMVILQDDTVVGFMLYKLHKDRLTLLAMSVHPDHRRQGAGKRMIHWLIDRLGRNLGRELIDTVPIDLARKEVLSLLTGFGFSPLQDESDTVVMAVCKEVLVAKRLVSK